MNNPTDKFSGIKPLRSPSNSDFASVPESDDAIRNLKASQSVEAAFLAVGMPNPPSDVAAVITNQVKGAIRNLPLDQVRNMTPGNGPLGTALAAVDQYIGMLTPPQRRAAQKGLNTLGPSEMLKVYALIGRWDGGGSASEPSSSRRYDDITLALTQTQQQALNLARKVGIDWTANNPDLLRLGPSAIQALADVHLQQESYERFKNGGLGAKAIVAGARYAKKHDIDYNEASKAFEETQQSLAPADQKVHSVALTKFNESAGKPAAKPAEEETAKKEFNKTMDELKNRNPSAKDKIEREQRILKTGKQEEHAATAKADVKTSAADAKETVAKKDVAAKQATKSKLLSSLD